MNQLVTIKGYKDGLVIQMNDLCDFEDILRSAAESFEKSRGFFKDSSLALSLEGRWLSPEEERALLQCIEAHSDINVICIMGADANTDRKFIKAVKRVESQRDDNNARVYSGNVTGEELVECEGTLIVLGDVETEATITATRDIIVLGNVYGTAVAGTGDHNNNHFVCAYSFDAKKIKIGDKVYHPIKEKALFAKKNKCQLKMIHVKNGVLCLDEANEELIRDVTSI